MEIKISTDPTMPQPIIDMLSAKGWSIYQNNLEMYAEVPDDVIEQDVLDIIAAFDPLPGCIADAHARIDNAAGEARARYITVAPGQDAVYALKKEQAESYKAEGYPVDTTKYLLIQAEANAMASSTTVACDYILATANQWMQLAAAIEQIRQSAKQSASGITDKSQWKNISQIGYDAVEQLNAV